MELISYLRQLYLDSNIDPTAYPWISELDRWANLVFCLLNRIHPDNEERVHSAVQYLESLNLLEVDKLATIEHLTEEFPFVIGYILRQHGFIDEEVERSITVLTQVSGVVHREFGGKLQRYLRQQGESFRDGLLNLFRSETLPETDMRIAITQWLQNSVNLPILQETDEVADFCKRNDISLEQLIAAVDELGLNLTFLNELLDIDSADQKLTDDQAEESED